MAFEKINSWTIWGAGVFSIIIIVITVVGLQAMYWMYERWELDRKVYGREYVAPAEYRDAQAKSLSEYGIADAEAGTISIPISEARKRFLAKSGK